MTVLGLQHSSRSSGVDGDTPLVSVTIPAFNHESFVEEAIESVMAQTYGNIDLMVIDDGSTDGTAGKIRACRARHPDRIRFISRDNQGLVRTLNLGIDQAVGKYWCQLASDDLMDQRNIQLKVEFLERHPEFDAVCSDGFCLHPDQTRTRMLPDQVKPDPLRVKNLRDLFRTKLFFPSLLFKRSTFKRIGNFDESLKYYEDIEMKLRLLMRCRVAYIDEPLLTWRLHAANTSKRTAPTRKEKIIAYEKFFSLPETKRHILLKRRMIGNEYYKYARFLIRDGQSDPDHSVFWYLLRSLFLHPFRPMAYYFLVRSFFRNPSKR